MPSKSPAQAKLMRAVAHGWKKPGGGGPTRAVASEFVNADRRSKVSGYQFGGPAQYMGQKPTMGPLSRDPRAMPPATTSPVGMRDPRQGFPGPGGPPPPRMVPPSMPPGGGRPGRGGRLGGRGGMPPGGGMPGRGGRGGYPGGGMPGRGGQMPWRGAPPPRAMPGGGGRGMPRPGGPPPQDGALRQMMQRLQGQQGGGRPGMMGRVQQMAGQQGGYPGGGNPMTGGRNPMMRQTGQYGGGPMSHLFR